MSDRPSSLPCEPWLPLLLADPSPCLRWLVLRFLAGRPEEDAEVQELATLREADPLVVDLLRGQDDAGAWQADGRMWQGGPVRATYLALMRLGYLGFDARHPAVQRGAAYLFAQQQPDGSWYLSGGEGDAREGYAMVPLQTALPLRGLAACGYATDERAERAYEWLLAQRLPDGAWPTGIASGVYGRVAGYRRLPHSQWGCRSNTTGGLICLALHPERCRDEAARHALDLLLGRETRETLYMGFEVARSIGAEAVRGFLTFYARFDLALLLDLCGRVGATLEDERVVDLAQFIEGLQGTYGLWEYAPRPQVSRWLTFDLLRSFARLGQEGDWISAEPRTPFQPYGRQSRRF